MNLLKKHLIVWRVGDSFLLRKERYLDRDTPKNLSILEVETRCPFTAASTFAETSVWIAIVNFSPECLWLFLVHQEHPEHHEAHV